MARSEGASSCRHAGRRDHVGRNSGLAPADGHRSLASQRTEHMAGVTRVTQLSPSFQLTLADRGGDALLAVVMQVNADHRGAPDRVGSQRLARGATGADQLDQRILRGSPIRIDQVARQ